MDRLQEWITHVFDHPVAGDIRDSWYWAEDAPEWEGARADIPALIAQTFEHSGELLARFSNAELDQGFWFLVGDSSPAKFMLALVDSKIPLTTRLRALRSFVPLFEQVMAIRCSADLSLPAKFVNPLNSACCMWWDLLWYQFTEDAFPREPDRVQFDAEILATLRRLLAIPHDACRESALHGLGHWARRCPQATGIVDEFLSGTPGLRPELIAYAEDARTGKVL